MNRTIYKTSFCCPMSSGSTISVIRLLAHLPDARCVATGRLASFQIITFGKAQDTTIESKSFPGRYPMGLNVTWSWSVTSGYWGVVFLDFDLDLGMDGYGDEDRLEISDGYRTPTFHTTRNPPVVPYRSRGAELLVRFISDTQTGTKDFRGFQLRILYGKTEPELNRKISLAEVAKEERRQNKETKE
ncbi:hypothetical protein ElyMa_003530000, partial [Elysia marginata]